MHPLYEKADKLSKLVIGAAIEVHRTLGLGLLESIYEEALCHESDLRGIRYRRQVEIDVVGRSVSRSVPHLVQA